MFYYNKKNVFWILDIYNKWWHYVGDTMPDHLAGQQVRSLYPFYGLEGKLVYIRVNVEMKGSEYIVR